MTRRAKAKRSDPLVAAAVQLSAEELHWLGVLAEHGVTDALRDSARAVLADGALEVDVRAARVASWAATCGVPRVCEHAPGGLGVHTEHEVKQARAWREVWATPELRNHETALYLAVLYAAPAPPPVHLGYGGCSARTLAVDLAARIAETRSRAWHAAWQWTPRGYVLRKGCTDPSLEWTETPQAAANRAMGVIEPDPRETAGQLRLSHTG